MSVLPLVTQPHKILRRQSVTIDLAKANDYQILARDMIETMLANNGIGLAAPQVGYNLTLFIINKEVADTPDHLVLCNPTITFQSAGQNVMEEGCLSCPTLYGNIRRPEKVRVKAYDLTGRKQLFKAKGLFAKVFQHEIDHLRGTLIIDKFINE
ncbi:MAG: peptide deformylase [Candidatus Kerfeldbacteria bacterium]|nr:peptide deformylase [Candidatus Kerfeldbacteria bacterium]